MPLDALRVAELVAAMQGLYGEAFDTDPTTQPAMAEDALATDDERGRRLGLVVTGDELTVSGLAALARLDPPLAQRLVPADLWARVEPLLADGGS